MASLTLSLALAASACVGAVFAYHHLPCCGSAGCEAGPGTTPAALSAASTSGRVPSERVTARCVEVRSASVFAGACHFNGELMTQGGELMLALSVESGGLGGEDLAGLCVVALVTSEANLKLEKPRRSIVYVSEAAGEAQRARLVELLEERSGHGLGEVLAVESASVAIATTDERFEVRVGEVLALSGEPLANRECCKMPNLVWYEPLVPLKQRRVGFTRSWSVSEPRLGLEFHRAEENSAFVGELALFAGACAAE